MSFLRHASTFNKNKEIDKSIRELLNRFKAMFRSLNKLETKIPNGQMEVAKLNLNPTFELGIKFAEQFEDKEKEMTRFLIELTSQYQR